MAGQTAELLQLGLGERRAHGGDRGAEARLVQREDVGVALDDERAILLRDRRAGPVEPVDDRALAEELALGRVHVLRRDRVVVAHAPRTEAEHPAARVGEREDEPARVVVVPAPVDEPGGHELVLREALRARLLGEHGAARREPEAVRAADLLPSRARRGRRAPARRPPTPRGCAGRSRGLLEQRQEPVAPLALCLGLRRRLLVRERDPVALGEPLDRADEVEAPRSP